jgi:hypothetical protein
MGTPPVHHMQPLRENQNATGRIGIEGKESDASITQ